MIGSAPSSSPLRGPRPLRARLYGQLEPAAWRDQGLSPLNRLLVLVIVAASLLAILETEPTLLARDAQVFTHLERALGVIFAAEYLARLWCAPERAPDLPAWRSRLGFMLSWAGLADLAVAAASFTPLVGPSLVLLRWIRIARILRLAKLGRMSLALRHMREAVASRAEELVLSLGFGAVLMVGSATALYLVEGPVQPDKFGSIPRALWWSVATLTTIGYGDVYPVTAAGKVLAGLTAILSIGLVAMPTGILAAAFSDGLQSHREARERYATAPTEVAAAPPRPEETA